MFEKYRAIIQLQEQRNVTLTETTYDNREVAELSFCTHKRKTCSTRSQIQISYHTFVQTSRDFLFLVHSNKSVGNH